MIGSRRHLDRSHALGATTDGTLRQADIILKAKKTVTGWL